MANIHVHECERVIADPLKVNLLDNCVAIQTIIVNLALLAGLANCSEIFTNERNLPSPAFFAQNTEDGIAALSHNHNMVTSPG